MERVATLGSPDDPVALNFIVGVTRTVDGLFTVEATFDPGLIAVYDSTGDFVKTIGREGRGPHEFLAPSVKLGPTGTDWIFDPGNGRVTPLLPGLELGDSFLFLGSLADIPTVPLDSNLVVVSGRVQQELSRPLHLMTGRGNIVRSFGEWPNTRTSPFPPSIAADRRGGIWSLPSNEYRLTRWSLSGAPVEVLQREAPWFEAWTERGPGQSFLLRLSMDSAGNLWVFGRTDNGDGLPGYDLESWDEMFDMVIEVIDPERGELIATRSFDEPILYPVQGTDAELLYAPRQSEIGYVRIDIFRARTRLNR